MFNGNLLSLAKEVCVLSLTRSIGEKIVIGDEIIVLVQDVKGNQVRLGVGAPKDVAVHREEIYDRINSDTPEPKKTR